MDAQSDTSVVLTLEDLNLAYQQGQREIRVLTGANGFLRAGESVALLGPSGAGKSSLLHMIGLLDRPDSGSVMFEGGDCSTLSDAERTRLRRSKLGFVYQFHHLLPEFTALENIVLPQLIAGVSRDDAETRAGELLASMGIGDRATHRPAELSGGEQQRVAIARAVANKPIVLLADEPTGNLDPPTAERVFQQLMLLVKEAGLATVIATHNFELAKRMDRIWRLENGALQEISPDEL